LLLEVEECRRDTASSLPEIIAFEEIILAEIL